MNPVLPEGYLGIKQPAITLPDSSVAARETFNMRPIFSFPFFFLTAQLFFSGNFVLKKKKKKADEARVETS